MGYDAGTSTSVQLYIIHFSLPIRKVSGNILTAATSFFCFKSQKGQSNHIDGHHFFVLIFLQIVGKASLLETNPYKIR
jgi:hypothetical protein